VSSQHYMEHLLKAIPWPLPRRLGDLIVLDTLRYAIVEALHSIFYQVALTGDKRTVLPCEQLVAVLLSDKKKDLFISGVIDEASETMTLWRGDRTSMVVPLSTFRSSGSGVKPEWNRFEITDFGQTLQFGEYQAGSDAVLYEFDIEYRRRLKRLRRDKEKGLGPSLRRLRKQRGLRRDQFTGLSAKTVARIEQGEVTRVHRRTMNILADKLGVPSEEIESY
ncbi:MAG: helix-turn-helix transcriptional regulator, partial [Phycisphaerae bacterium]|nr:helix-turn-helix transcriptional regulator [Phycisphaerae bacterium]